VGASWSTAKPNKNLIGVNNGGKGLSQTSDDGHLNFKKGETFSKIFKGIHDLELKYGDTGVFVRGKYWYDFELKDEGREFKDISDSNRKEGAKSSGARSSMPSSTTTTPSPISRVPCAWASRW
jgi:hypothetical protein